MSAALKIAKAGARGRGPGSGRGQGDPGFPGHHLFRGAVGAVKGGVGALFTGGNPLTGAIAGGVRGFTRGGRPAVSQVTLPSIPRFGGPGPPGLPEGVTIASGINGATAPSGTPSVQPAGFHANKSSYFLIDGTFIAKGTRWVKNRRRNALNPRALGRAISRIDAGKVWQGKLHEISTAKFTAAGNKKD